MAEEGQVTVDPESVGGGIPGLALASSRHPWSGTERTEERMAAGAAPGGQWNSDLDSLNWRQSFAEFEGEARGQKLGKKKDSLGPPRRWESEVTENPGKALSDSGVPD